MWFCNECGSSFEEPAYEHEFDGNPYGEKKIEYITCPECESGEVEEVTDEELEEKIKDFEEYVKDNGDSYVCWKCKEVNYYLPPICRHIKTFREFCKHCNSENFIERS